MAIDDIKFGRCPKPPKPQKPGKFLFFFCNHEVVSEGFNAVFLMGIYNFRNLGKVISILRMLKISYEVGIP